VESAPAQKLYDDFIEYLEYFLDTAKIDFSTKELWESEGCDEQNLDSYLEAVGESGDHLSSMARMNLTAV
jgi:hypothetical protein